MPVSFQQTLGYETILAELQADRATRRWGQALARQVEQAFCEQQDGNLARWSEAFLSLPDLPSGERQFGADAVRVDGEISAEQRARLQAALQAWPWCCRTFSSGASQACSFHAPHHPPRPQKKPRSP